ncbi:MAG: hypothetical protein VX574_11405 [Myxococcota bacterium]|nr:hypothetical protein [Myxococcota bacterium]
MTPELGRFLEVASGHLLQRSAPALEAGYEQSSVMTLGILLGVAREEVDRAAARRFEENEALREFFREWHGVVENEELRSRAVAAGGGSDPSLRVPDLEKNNATLRALLIEVHAQIEEQEGDEARACEDALWRELALSTERRRLSLGPF